MTPTMSPVEIIAQILTDHGANPGANLESWPCEMHPTEPGPCRCITDLAEDIFDALGMTVEYASRNASGGALVSHDVTDVFNDQKHLRNRHNSPHPFEPRSPAPAGVDYRYVSPWFPVLNRADRADESAADRAATCDA